MATRPSTLHGQALHTVEHFTWPHGQAHYLAKHSTQWHTLHGHTAKHTTWPSTPHSGTLYSTLYMATRPSTLHGQALHTVEHFTWPSTLQWPSTHGYSAKTVNFLSKVGMLMVWIIYWRNCEIPVPQIDQQVDDVGVCIQITLILWMTWFWAIKVH